MKWAISENTVSQCDLVDFIDACAVAGIHAVELNIVKLKDALRFVSPGDLTARFRKHGIEIVTLNSLEDSFLVPADGIPAVEADVRLMGELCRSVECPAIVAPSGRWFEKYGPRPDKDETTLLYRGRLLLFQDILRDYGVELWFEPIAFPEFVVGTIPWTNEILSAPGLGSMAVVPDIHNLHINGDGPGQLSDLTNTIGIFHIDDSLDLPAARQDVCETRCFPGQGIADAATWVRIAKAHGFDGYYSLEIFDEEVWAMEPAVALQLCRDELETFESSL